ncbi:MAG: PIN domain-containing protein [Gemmatimonadetes bacterium]|nr:PIN domain-containing protein [Gemmatimonadota bacterium]
MRSSTIADPSHTTTAVFLDTNVLVDCADHRDLSRQQLCRAATASLMSVGRATISTQVLQEFYTACIRKLGLSSATAHTLVRQYRRLPIVTVTPDLIDQAIVLHQSQQISFWDALIVAAAASAGCRTLLTEDLNAGQIIAGVEIVRPEESHFG